MQPAANNLCRSDKPQPAPTAGETFNRRGDTPSFVGHTNPGADLRFLCRTGQVTAARTGCPAPCRNADSPGIIRVSHRTSGIFWSKLWHKFVKFAAKGRSPAITSVTRTTSPDRKSVV